MNKLKQAILRAAQRLKKKSAAADFAGENKNVKAGAVARFLLRIVLYIVISLVLAFGIYGWNAKTLGGNRMPMPFGMGMSVVLSGSMEPTLSVNDLVFVKTAESYAVGDVVVYQSGNILVIHRIVAISPDGTEALTKGDANNIADDPIAISDIKGKMVGKLSGVGGVVTALRSPLGVVTVLAVAVALTVLSGRAEQKKQNEKTAAVKEEIRLLKEEMKMSSETDMADKAESASGGNEEEVNTSR